MVAVFTVTEVNYPVVSLLNDLVRPSSYLLQICDIKFFGCTICFVSGIVKKTALASPKPFTIF